MKDQAALLAQALEVFKLEAGAGTAAAFAPADMRFNEVEPPAAIANARRTPPRLGRA
jgi:hypothetical protein